MTIDTLEKPASLTTPSNKDAETSMASQNPSPRSNHSMIEMTPGECTHLRSQNNGTLLIENQNGEVELKIVWDQGRAEVSMSRANLKLESIEDLNIQCQNFRVASQENLEFEAGQKCSIESKEHLRLRSKVVEATATLGDILLQANDFVRALGEKILLNTDRDPEESQRRTKSFLNKLIGY